MPDPSPPLRLSEQTRRKPTRFALAPDEATTAAIAGRLGLLGLRKLRFVGALHPLGKQDWRLEATLGATVVQPCAVTLAPVTTRIDEPVLRRYLAELPEDGAEPGAEIEMPEDDSLDPLPVTLDLAEVMEEALVLALPVWPRASGLRAADLQVAPPGTTPLDDGAMRPFAGLAALRDRLSGETADDAPAPRSASDRDPDPLG